MFKKTICALALTLVSGVAFAAVPAGTFGVGVSHSGGGENTIFVPITLENGLWVEPFVSYNNSEVTASGNETTNIDVGVGLFKNFFTTANTRAYLGGRIGYSYYEVDPAGANNSTDSNGVLIQPTLGFGYAPVDNILFGAEAYVSYNDSDITGSETLGTGTSLFVRYFFAQ